ncbi:MAG: hypothetical protein QOH24_1172 [Verrucomicrobiota bacterium]
MKLLLESLLFVTLISAAAVWFYWVALFPCIALHFRFRIQEFADDAYIGLREGRISAVSFLTLEYFLDLAKKVASYSEMLGLAPKIAPDKAGSEKLEKRMNEASQDPEIREAFFGVTRSMVAISLFSDPIELLTSRTATKDLSIALFISSRQLAPDSTSGGSWCQIGYCVRDGSPVAARAWPIGNFLCSSRPRYRSGPR